MTVPRPRVLHRHVTPCDTTSPPSIRVHVCNTAAPSTSVSELQGQRLGRGQALPWGASGLTPLEPDKGPSWSQDTRPNLPAQPQGARSPLSQVGLQFPVQNLPLPQFSLQEGAASGSGSESGTHPWVQSTLGRRTRNTPGSTSERILGRTTGSTFKRILGRTTESTIDRIMGSTRKTIGSKAGPVHLCLKLTSAAIY